MTAIRTLAAAAFLLFWAAVGAVQAQESVKRHRIAIVIPSGPVARISASGGSRFYQAIFEELRRLGDIEGQNLIVERYSGEGRGLRRSRAQCRQPQPGRDRCGHRPHRAGGPRGKRYTADRLHWR